jgi:hypothetical protein
LFFQKYIDNTLSSSNYEALNKSIRVFPNPTSDLIHLDHDIPIQFNKVILYNSLGVSIKVNLTNRIIDITNLNSGIYFLKIETSIGSITKKIIKK